MAKVVEVKRSEFLGATVEFSAKEFEFLYRLLGNHVIGGPSGSIYMELARVAKVSGISGRRLTTDSHYGSSIRILDDN